MADKSETYSIKMHCRNCKMNGMVEFPRGTLVEDVDKECPTCGCTGQLARVVEPVVQTVPVPVPSWPRGPYVYNPNRIEVTYQSFSTIDAISAGTIGRRIH